MQVTPEAGRAADPAASKWLPRCSARHATTGIAFPFLGTNQADRAAFQYLLRDISAGGAQILLPNWVVKRERLRGGEQIDFHLPFVFDGITYSRGCLVWAMRDQQLHWAFAPDCVAAD